MMLLITATYPHQQGWQAKTIGLPFFISGIKGL